MNEISGSFTIEQVDTSFRDAMLATASTRHDVMATMGDGTQVVGWLDVNDIEVTDDFARGDIDEIPVRRSRVANERRP